MELMLCEEFDHFHTVGCVSASRKMTNLLCFYHHLTLANITKDRRVALPEHEN